MREGEGRCGRGNVEGWRKSRKTELQLYFAINFSYAFGLEETNYHQKAEQVAREALAIQRRTPFAHHTMGELDAPSVM